MLGVLCSDLSPGCRPSGARMIWVAHPPFRFAPGWANLCRAYGAGSLFLGGLCSPQASFPHQFLLALLESVSL